MATNRIRPAVRVHVDQVVRQSPACPAHLEHLLVPPEDRDDAVAVLRWGVAWALEWRTLEQLAVEARVPVAALSAFVEQPAVVAGGVLTLAQAARLMRLLEVRIEDRELAGEADDHRRIAQPYIEAAGLDYRRALRRARRVRRAYRAANPGASTLGLD